MRALVIGVGNEFRRDDGIGPAAARELARLGVPADITDGDPVRLLEAWEGADLVVVVDAVRSSASPGSVHRVELRGGGESASSTHGFGLPEAVELARALDRLPRRLVVFAVEAREVGFGTALSEPVAGALPVVVEAVLAELGRS